MLEFVNIVFQNLNQMNDSFRLKLFDTLDVCNLSAHVAADALNFVQSEHFFELSRLDMIDFAQACLQRDRLHLFFTENLWYSDLLERNPDYKVLVIWEHLHSVADPNILTVWSNWRLVFKNFIVYHKSFYILPLNILFITK